MNKLTIARYRLFVLLAIILSLPDPISPIIRMYKEGFNLADSLNALRLFLIYIFFTIDIFISSTIPWDKRDLRTKITMLRNIIEQLISLNNNVNNYANDERAYLINLKNSIRSLLNLINNNH